MLTHRGGMVFYLQQMQLLITHLQPGTIKAKIRSGYLPEIQYLLIKIQRLLNVCNVDRYVVNYGKIHNRQPQLK